MTITRANCGRFLVPETIIKRVYRIKQCWMEVEIISLNALMHSVHVTCLSTYVQFKFLCLHFQSLNQTSPISQQISNMEQTVLNNIVDR